MRPRHQRLALSLSATLAVGCQPSSSRERREVAATTAAPAGQPEAKPPPRAKPNDPPAPGRAYVNVEATGLFVLDDQGWRALLDSRAPIRDMIEIRGRLYLLSDFGVQRLTPSGTPAPVAKLAGEDYRALGQPEELIGDSRRFWVLGHEGLGTWAAGSWSVTALSEIAGAPLAGPRGRDLAPLGRDAELTPVLAAGQLVRKEGEGWTKLEGSPGATRAVPAPDGSAVFVYGCTTAAATPRCLVTRHGSGEPLGVELPVDPCAGRGELAIDPAGERGVVASACGVTRFELAELGPAAKPPKVAPVELERWHGQPVLSLALDARGRVWTGTPSGLSILDAEGKLSEYPIARLGEVSGRVVGVLVSGEGPPPPTLGRVHHGGIGGTVVREVGGEQVPVAGAKVELCDRRPPPGAAPSAGASLCQEADPVHRTTTNERGEFELDGIPLAHYWVAVEIEGGWYEGAPKAMSMRAGMMGRIGAVVIAEGDADASASK